MKERSTGFFGVGTTPGWWYGFPPNATADWFMVVRNPFERIVSEIHCKWGGVGTRIRDMTAREINEEIRSHIHKNDPAAGGHYTPQARYKLVAPRFATLHVLHYENLAEEFAQLMSLYSIPVTLGARANTSPPSRFGVSNAANDCTDTGLLRGRFRTVWVSAAAQRFHR